MADDKTAFEKRYRQKDGKKTAKGKIVDCVSCAGEGWSGDLIDDGRL